MDNEINLLVQQNTWQITRLPSNRKALKGRQVYKIKTNKEGEIIKYKARWVVKGFSQIYGLDYLETFANTTRLEIIKLLLYYVVFNNLQIRQQDFKNAFVHATIDKEIYVEQPIDYINNLNIINNNNIDYNIILSKTKDNKDLVYKLNKALYGLKQSPRLQYNYLANKLKLLGFIPIILEQGVFINKDYNIFIIVYVDDILAIGLNLNMINLVKSNLAKLDLDLEDLGDVSYFLGMEITRTKDSISLSQTKYLKNILEKYNKTNLNPVSSPNKPSIKLEKSILVASKDKTNYY